MEEVWKAIPGYQHYEASNLGNLRLLGHEESFIGRWGKPMSRYRKSKVLSQRTGDNNRMYASVKNHTQQVSRLVAKAFYGEPTGERQEINHLDGNASNNNVDNLQWCTRSENELHAYRVLGKQTWNKGIPFDTTKQVAARRKNYLPKCLDTLAKRNFGIPAVQIARTEDISTRQVYTRIKTAEEHLASVARNELTINQREEVLND